MSGPSLQSVLSLRSVSRSFGDVHAVDGVSLEISAGEVVGLLGHNGAGKTTLVRLFAGLLAPTSGVVRVSGMDPLSDGIAVRRLLGVMPTASILDVRLTARANLEFVADLFGVSRSPIDSLLSEFDLADRADDKVEGFSAGMKQRLALARVLLPSPQILLLDEPSAALDPLAVRMVRSLIGRLSSESGRTVVLCTHDLAEAQLLCDRVVVLDHGKVVAFGTPAELGAGLAAGVLDIEVAVSDVTLARKTLAHLTMDEVPGTNGSTTVVLRGGPAARSDVPSLVGALVDAGVSVFAVQPYSPTLEDVYVNLYASGSAGRTL